MRSFEEVRKESNETFKKRNEISQKLSELSKKFREQLTEENLSKLWAPYEVGIDHYYSYGVAYIKDNNIKLYEWDNCSIIERFVERYKDKDFNLFRSIGVKSSWSYEEAVEHLEETKKEMDMFNEKVSSITLPAEFAEIRKLLDEYKELNSKTSSLYNEAYAAFVTERYGTLGDIVIGKTYYLYDTKLQSKVALVEVLSKDESGLGYKCVDHEADDKKYVHVRKDRLEVDLRGFPKDELIYGPTNA